VETCTDLPFVSLGTGSGRHKGQPARRIRAGRRHGLYRSITSQIRQAKERRPSSLSAAPAGRVIQVANCTTLPSSDSLRHEGSAFALELPVGGAATVRDRNVGLSMLVVQTLYQANSVKIVRPTMLTRICIQIALLISIKTK
jgi:hypothetical protein